MDRTILHCDCNGFYASVECILNPKLKKVPMAVGGDPENRRGIILAKNQLAKEFGVQTAETIWQAKRKCPDLVVVPPHHDVYEDYSIMINEIYRSYTDLVEKFGIDESWLDVTGSTHLFGTGEEIANILRKRVKEEIGLTISVGVSFNKVFAKLGSDYKKPDATTVISRENFKKIVDPLPVEALLFVGKNTANALKKIQIKTIGDLANTDPLILKQLFGKAGGQLTLSARGEENSPVKSAYEEEDLKSVGNGMTFRRNLIGEEDIRQGVLALSDTVATRLRQHHVKCSTLQVMIKDPDFKTISRQKTLSYPTQLAKEIATVAMEIIKESWKMDDPIRMITITGQNIASEDENEHQLSLFYKEEEKNAKQERLEKTMDAIREKYGNSAVLPGGILRSDLGIVKKKN